MDNLTHSLFGWTLARAGLGREVPYATATLILASNAPDLDIVTVAGGGIEYLAAHRGPTHGPLGIVGLGLLVAGIVAAWARWRGTDAVTIRAMLRWWVLAMAGVAGHVAMDLPTAYGTRPLSPFDATWYALDWLPIIDVVLWGILAAGVIAGRVTGRRARTAAVALALMGADYAGRAALHDRALAQGRAVDASGAPAPCATAPTLVRHPVPPPPGDGPTPSAADPCVAAAALPTFGSPFTWRIVRQHPGRYEISDRDVWRGSALQRTVLTTEGGPAVRRAADTRTGAVYFDFARFPIARVTTTGPSTTVRLFDARFVGVPRNEALTDARTSLSVVVRLEAHSIGSSRGRGPLGNAASMRASSASVN